MTTIKKSMYIVEHHTGNEGEVLHFTDCYETLQAAGVAAEKYFQLINQNDSEMASLELEWHTTPTHWVAMIGGDEDIIIRRKELHVIPPPPKVRDVITNDYLLLHTRPEVLDAPAKSDLGLSVISLFQDAVMLTEKMLDVAPINHERILDIVMLQSNIWYTA